MDHDFEQVAQIPGECPGCYYLLGMLALILEELLPTGRTDRQRGAGRQRQF